MHDLERLGFAEEDEDKFPIPDDQLQYIVNIDKIHLSLNGNNGQQGDQPKMVFYCTKFPQFGKGTSRSCLSSIMIHYSNNCVGAINLMAISNLINCTVRTKSAVAQFFD